MNPVTAVRTSNRRLNEILAKAQNERPLATQELRLLLSLTEDSQRSLVYQTARWLRQKHFGNKIFLYGFIYTSTFCRNECSFCFYRRSNPNGRRYRKNTPEIVSAAIKLAQSGVHLIDLTMGEDPMRVDNPAVADERLCEQVASVSRATGLPVMVSPGLVPENLLKRIKASGATWFACYQETHTPGLFDRLRPGQDFSSRLEIKTKAHRLGLLVEEGVLCGVGETISDLVHSIETMKILDADQVRAMKFIPQQGTPMENRRPSVAGLDALFIAALRLVFPRRLIPASLDVEGIAGLKNSLDAGANVVTSIVPPDEGLSGVARHSLDIEDGRRTAGEVSKLLKRWDLEAASADEYGNWIASRQVSVVPD